MLNLAGLLQSKINDRKLIPAKYKYPCVHVCVRARGGVRSRVCVWLTQQASLCPPVPFSCKSTCWGRRAESDYISVMSLSHMHL